MRFLSDMSLRVHGICLDKASLHLTISSCLRALSGACVRLAEEQEVSIDTLTLEQLQKIDARFEEDVMKVWDYEQSVERKSSIGGTSKARVLEQIQSCIEFAGSL